MALTQQQEAMVGVYGKLPHVVNRFFTRRIKRGKIPFVTNAKVLNFEVVEEFARKAKILQRGAEFPKAKLKGSVIKAVAPEVIKDSFPFFADDQLNRQAGMPIYVNGQKVDNRTYERDRRIAGLKQSIETVQEEISAGVFLKGTYKSPDTLNEVKYDFANETSIAKTNIKDDWAIWLTKQVNEFTKNRKVSVSEILVGEKIFNELVKAYNTASNKIIPASVRRVQTEDGDFELHFDAFGFDLVMIPQVTDTEGKPIDFSDKIIFYNDLAYLPAYAGVTNVVNKVASLEAIDVLIRETSADEKTGEAETLGESAYCPLVVNPSLVKIVKITGLS